MSETHELRLKINAAAAKAGAREFVGAINSIKTAMQSLDKTSTGAFTKFDTTKIKSATQETTRFTTASKTAADQVKRMALASASAFRTSQNEVSTLSKRLLALGDNAGIDRLQADLRRLQADLERASTPLDIRVARSAFQDSSATARRNAQAQEVEARATREAAKAAQAKAAQLDALRATYNPLFAASKQYETVLEEIAFAEREGVLTSQMAADARQRAAVALQSAGTQAAAFTRHANVSSFATANMAAQFNDIGVMLASGQSPLLLAVQQGTQISQVLNQMGNRASILATLRSGFLSMINPVSLVTIGVIAGGAALAQWAMSAWGAEDAAEAFENRLDELQSLQGALSDSTDILSMSVIELADEYGNASVRVRELAMFQAQLRIAELTREMSQQTSVLRDVSSAYITNAEGGRTLRNTLLRLERDFGLTGQAARDFESALQQAASAETLDAQIAGLQQVQSILDAAGIEASEIPPELAEALSNMIDLSRETDKARQTASNLESIIAGVTGQTQSWADRMAGVRAEISAIGSALASIGGGAINNAAMQAELTALNEGQSIRDAEIARRRFQANAEFDAREAGASGFGERLVIGFERAQFEEAIRLENELDAARTRARESARAASETSAGRASSVATEAQAVSDLTARLQDRIIALEEEQRATSLVAEGQFQSIEAARLMAQAQMIMGGTVDEGTAALLRQIDALESLGTSAQAGADAFAATVPTWQQATSSIEGQSLNHLSDAISKFAQTGKLDFESLGASILQTASDIIADIAVKELLGLLGGGLGGAGGGGGLGGIIGAIVPALFGSGGGVVGGGGPSIPQVMAPAGMFRTAPHFAMGTPNVSGGVPAILHDNEAVVPLTGGRKIPIEGGNMSGGSTVVNNVMHIQTPDADSFRKSQTQIAAEAGMASQRAIQRNR